jgi:hypothetical protein
MASTATLNVGPKKRGGGKLATDWPPKPREQTGITVAKREQTSLFLLIFSIAIYVRDAGVAGSNPATPTILSSTYTFDDFCAQRNAQ